jgi:hypothetical protein
MNLKSKLTLFAAAMFAALTLSSGAMAQTPAPAAKPKTNAPAASTSKPAATKAAPTAAPTQAEIADAQSKGMVWVNTSTKVYHKSGKFYGATKHGKFMTEADAQKAGYKEAKEGPAAKKSTTTKKTSTTASTKK